MELAERSAFRSAGQIVARTSTPDWNRDGNWSVGQIVYAGCAMECADRCTNHRPANAIHSYRHLCDRDAMAIAIYLKEPQAVRQAVGRSRQGTATILVRPSSACRRADAMTRSPMAHILAGPASSALHRMPHGRDRTRLDLSRIGSGGRDFTDSHRRTGTVSAHHPDRKPGWQVERCSS